jgi:hypothetical protein
MAGPQGAKGRRVPNLLGLDLVLPDPLRRRAQDLAVEARSSARRFYDVGRAGLARLAEAELERQKAEQLQAQAITDGVRRLVKLAPQAARSNPRSPPAAHRREQGAPSPHRRTRLREVGQQARAGIEGVEDGLTFGLGDRFEALQLANLSADWLPNMTWRERYDLAFAHLKAEDQFDIANYGNARLAGEVLGAVGGIAATGGLGAAPAGAARVATLAPRLMSWGSYGASRVVAPHVAAAGGGAAVSVTGLAASDLALRRPSSPASYAATAVGGATGGLTAIHVGPRTAAGVEAVTSAAVESALGGDKMSLRDIVRQGAQGAYFAGPADIAGQRWSNGLNMTQKGKLGSLLAEGQIRIEGGEIMGREKNYAITQVAPGSRRGKNTRVDIVDEYNDRLYLNEAKFGFGDLTPNQKIAQAEYGDIYRVLRYLPEDIGRMTGAPLALFSAGGEWSDR